MAKISAIQKNKKRAYLISKFSERRSELKRKIKDLSIPIQERFKLVMELSKLPRNSSKVRFRNRCHISGRSRGYVGDFCISRINFRELAQSGKIPGVLLRDKN